MAPFPGVGFSPPGMISGYFVLLLGAKFAPCVLIDKTNDRVVEELLTVLSRKSKRNTIINKKPYLLGEALHASFKPWNPQVQMECGLSGGHDSRHRFVRVPRR